MRLPWLDGLDHVARTTMLSWERNRRMASEEEAMNTMLPTRSSEKEKGIIVFMEEKLISLLIKKISLHTIL